MEATIDVAESAANILFYCRVLRDVKSHNLRVNDALDQVQPLRHKVIAVIYDESCGRHTALCCCAPSWSRTNRKEHGEGRRNNTPHVFIKPLSARTVYDWPCVAPQAGRLADVVAECRKATSPVLVLWTKHLVAHDQPSPERVPCVQQYFCAPRKLC